MYGYINNFVQNSFCSTIRIFLGDTNEALNLFISFSRYKKSWTYAVPQNLKFIAHHKCFFEVQSFTLNLNSESVIWVVCLWKREEAWILWWIMMNIMMKNTRTVKWISLFLQIYLVMCHHSSLFLRYGNINASSKHFLLPKCYTSAKCLGLWKIICGWKVFPVLQETYAQLCRNKSEIFISKSFNKGKSQEKVLPKIP